MLGDPVQLLLPTPLYLFALPALVFLLARRQPARRRRRLRIAATIVLAWLWVCVTPGFGNLLVVALEGPPAEAAASKPLERDASTLILVLASGRLFTADGRTGARLDASGWERAAGAVRLWRRTGGTLLFSGGPSGDPSASIADAMAQVARDMGVPESAIRLSPAGLNTFEEMAAEAGVARSHAGRRWLVSSALHLPRVAWIAGCFGIEAEPYPVDFQQIENVTWRSWLPASGAPLLLEHALHEVAGLAWYRTRYECPTGSVATNPGGPDVAAATFEAAASSARFIAR